MPTKRSSPDDNACFACLNTKVQYTQSHLACVQHGPTASMAKRTDPKLRVTGAALPGKAFRRPGPGPAPLPSPPPFGAGGGRRLRAAAGVQSRWRPALPPEGTGPSRAAAGKRQDRTSSPSASGATSTASDERGGVESPPQPALRATTAEWLPPRAFLPPDTAPAAARVWTAWDPTQGTTPRPRNLGRVGAGHEAWDAQTALNDLTAAVAADRVYESVGALAADLRAQLAALEASPEFRPWHRLHPAFKPRLSGLLATMQGPPRRVTVLLDRALCRC